MLTRNGYQRLAREIQADERKALRSLSEAFTAKEIKPEEFSIRQLAEHVVPDGREWVASMDPRYGDSTYQEAAGAVSLAAFSNITGQIVYNKMLESYNKEEFVFTNLVQTIPTQFSGEKIPGVGGLGDNAAIVDEGKPYPLVGLNEDWIETPATLKRGFMVPVTKEAVFFDRTNLVLQRAGEVGDFLGVNKEIRIIDAIVDENTTAARYKWKGTTYATYQATTPWVNIAASNALVDWTDIDAALLVAAAIVDPNTGLPIVNIGSDMVVCQQLVATAARVLNATQVAVHVGGYATSGNLNSSSSPNPVMGLNGYSPASYTIRTSKLLSSRMATKTSWFIGDVRKAFAYMENWPLAVVQAPPNSEAEFTQDIVMRFKASERGAAATLDPRHMVKSTA